MGPSPKGSSGHTKQCDRGRDGVRDEVRVEGWVGGEVRLAEERRRWEEEKGRRFGREVVFIDDVMLFPSPM